MSIFERYYTKANLEYYNDASKIK